MIRLSTCFSLLMLLCAAPGQALATLSLGQLSFGSLVRTSGVIFVGTVANVRVERLDRTIVTHVTFRDARFIKGQREASPQLTVAGGVTPEGEGIYYEGQPHFEHGRRYIVLSDADMGSPANGYHSVMDHCLFSVSTHGTGGRSAVANSNHQSIARVQADDLIFLSRSELDKGKRPMTEDGFLRAVLEIVERQERESTEGR